MVEKFGLSNSKTKEIPCVKHLWSDIAQLENDKILDAVTKYREIVGSLLYLQQVSQADISFVVNVLCQQMAKPTSYSWNLAI